jgi:hypothetical protein
LTPLPEEPPNNDLSLGQALLKAREKGISRFEWKGRKYSSAQTKKAVDNLRQ